MAFNPKSLQNLRQFQKGQSGNPNGRPPYIINRIREIPPGARDRVYEALNHIIMLPNVKAVKTYLEDPVVEESLGEYGFVLQLAAKQLLSKRGWLALNDSLDRLFGKPKQTTQLSGGGTVGEKPMIEFGDPDTEGEED